MENSDTRRAKFVAYVAGKDKVTWSWMASGYRGSTIVGIASEPLSRGDLVAVDEQGRVHKYCKQAQDYVPRQLAKIEGTDTLAEASFYVGESMRQASEDCSDE